MSERIAEVIEVKLLPHPNADSLSIVSIGNFSVCVRTSDWRDNMLGIYVVPDSICDSSREEFKFLSPDKPGPVRVKVKKLRGVFSQGLLIPAPEGAKVGENLYEALGISHYEPEAEYLSTGGNWEKAPPNWTSLQKYNLENLRHSKYQNLFTPDEDVCVTSKLNGANLGFVYSNGEIYVKSRSGFRCRADNIFWRGLTPTIEEFLKKNEDVFLLGEIIGNVKGFKYDCEQGQVSFRAFDLMGIDRAYYNVNRFFDTCDKNGIQAVPNLGTHKFNMDNFLQMAELPCPISSGVQEGIVIKSMTERYDYRLGRAACKIVSNKYLEKN